MIRRFIAAALIATSAQSASAQDTTLAHIELNALDQVAQACRISFTAKAPGNIDSAVLETVLFDTDGAVALLTLFDFGALPANKIRVRQFDLANTACASVGMILFNGVDSCTGAACGSEILKVSSRVKSVEVQG